MEFHICILSTMSAEMTQANFRLFDIECEFSPGSIQKIRWPRAMDISITLWVAHCNPVSAFLLENLLPFMDVCVCWYHDHSAISCLKVRNAVSTLNGNGNNVWLMASQVPRLRDTHKSRVKKMYDDNGFLRPRCKDYTLDKQIEEILRSELKVQKRLYSF